MTLRWRRGRLVQVRNATPDPVAEAVWEEGHLTGPTATAPIIHAPRAGDIAPHAG
jgi:hypothetical protein